MIDDPQPVDDGEILLRTDFSPIHVQDGKLVPAAIRADDLSERGFSVDREELADVSNIEARASIQMEKKPEDRQSAWITPFQCGPVRAEKFPQDDENAFRIEPRPVFDNPAHASIYSYRQRKPSHIKALKSILLPHLNAGLVLLDKYKESRKNASGAEDANVAITDESDSSIGTEKQ